MKPAAKAAPSHCKGNMINPSKALMGRWKAKVARHFGRNHNGYRGALTVEITSYFKRPPYHYRIGMGSTVTRLAIEAPHFHIQKPDADNLAKFALDCLTGLAYHDDAQICDCTSKKRWTTTGAINTSRSSTSRSWSEAVRKEVSCVYGLSTY